MRAGQDAQFNRMSAFLRRVLVMEIEGRKQAAHEKRLKAAKLPTRKTLEAFDFAFQPSIDERQVWELADLAFVKTHRNVVFLGPPGVGKTQPTNYPNGDDGVI